VHETDKETAGGFFGGKTGGILYRTSGTIKNQRRWGNGGFEGVWGWGWAEDGQPQQQQQPGERGTTGKNNDNDDGHAEGC